MKPGKLPPLLETDELRQAVQTVRRYVSPPAENEEGYDPHVEHRDYERLKEEMRIAREELAKARAHERELRDTLDEMSSRPASAAKRPGTDWKRAVVLSEVLGTPRCRRK